MDIEPCILMYQRIVVGMGIKEHRPWLLSMVLVKGISVERNAKHTNVPNQG